MRQKWLYLFFFNIDFVISFLFIAFTTYSEIAFEVYLGQYAILYTLLTPLMHILCKVEQYTNPFLVFKTFLNHLFVAILILVFKYFIYSNSVFYFLSFGALILVIILDQLFNEKIARVVYQVIGITKEEDNFEFPEIECFDESNEDILFFQYKSHPDVLFKASYYRKQLKIFDVNEKQKYLCTIMKEIIKTYKLEKRQDLYDERSERINFLFKSPTNLNSFDVDSSLEINYNLFTRTERDSKLIKKKLTSPLPDSSFINFQDISFSNKNSLNVNENKQSMLNTKNEFQETIFESISLKWKNIKVPNSKFFKFIYYLFYPFNIFFSMTLLDFRSDVSTRKIYLHFILCTIYLAILVITICALSIDLIVIFCPKVNFIGLILGGFNLSFVYYCYSFTKHSNKFINVTIMEMMNVQLPILFFLIAIVHYFQEFTIFLNNLNKNSILFSIIVLNSLIFLVQTIYYKNKIPFASHFLNFIPFFSYIICLLIL